jgi:hypothetical protein
MESPTIAPYAPSAVDDVGQVGDPGVLDDAVDELIELVLARGGWVALLTDSTLPAATRVALTLHP